MSIIITRLIFSALSTPQFFFKPPDDKIIRSFYNILRYYSVRLGKESNGWLNLSGGSKKYGFKISENIRYIPNRSSFK